MKLNNKGFAITGIIYSILLLFIVLIVGILMMLGNRKILLDKLKEEIIDKIENKVIYKDNSGANEPILLNNMVPVKHDGSSWVVADIHEKWYDYDNKEWANAVILKSGVSKNVGDIVNVDSDVALMYVWIPRFKYTIWNGNYVGRNVREINVSFENGYDTTGTVECTDNLSGSTSEICGLITDDVSTYTHPAFSFDGNSLTGFWVGKFEVSTTDTNCLTNQNEASCNINTHILETKPNSSSLRYIDIKNMFESNLNIASNYNITDGDSHTIKSMEWGAVLYLMNSKYGRCIDGACTDAKNIGTNSYETSEGQTSSSTNNIYGVYSLRDGFVEMVMGKMDSSSGNFTNEFEEKYYDIYTWARTVDSLERGKLGDATKETMYSERTVWYGGGYPEFMYSSNNWMLRSGYASGTTHGSFFLSSFKGTAEENVSSRNVLVRR